MSQSLASELDAPSHNSSKARCGYDGLMSTSIKFGFPEEWEDSSERNAQYFDKFPHLKTAFDQILVRTISDTTLADKIILFLGRLCLEDFMEIMCLAANGYGYGALKLVRGLYERAVVIYYLVANPNKTIGRCNTIQQNFFY